jgi:hypothetical protein
MELHVFSDEKVSAVLNTIQPSRSCPEEISLTAVLTRPKKHTYFIYKVYPWEMEHSLAPI